ncbi:MAG TPA: UDP-glucuronic acid decarboxylase family protein [Candidatus Dormibacteraeota bacterium]|nr:UDP-glucuronic acid decarboxylase family protein [Candidatus Dormibacteraeota bacterium]
MNVTGVVLPRRLRRAVITGGAGFIGSHLCDRLLQRGMRVVCLDNLLTGSIDNVAHLFSNPRFSFRRYDVTEYLYVEDEVDAILHFASPASPVDYAQMPIETLKVGTLGTHKALGLARAKRARFLLASTSEVYGDPEVHPQSEEYWGNVNPVGPRSIYDEAKRAAEAFVMAYHNAHGLDTRIARIFNTFGPRMRRGDGRAVPAFITQALAGKPLTVFGDGSQTRSLCYIDDLVDGLERLLAADCHLPVNLGNPGELTVLELAETIRRLVGGDSPVELRPLPVDDPRRRRPDITRAQRLLDWSPRVALEEGLARTVAWWQEGGPHARVDLATAAG